MNKLLEKLIKGKNKDQHFKEVHLSKNYNEFLLYQDLIEKIEIAQHYRILQMAIKNNDNISYDSFASFLINQLENGKKDFSILMTLVDIRKIIKIAKLTNFDGSPFKIPDDYILECICTDKQATDKNFDSITTQIYSVFNTIKKQLSEIIDQRNTFQKALNDIKSDISDIQNKQDLLKSKISYVKKNIKSEISNINENIESKASDINKNIKSEISNINKNIKLEISNINENIKSKFINKQEEINNGNKDFVQKQISDAQDKNKELLISTINDLKKTIQDIQTNSNNIILSNANENKKSIDLQIKDVKDNIPQSFHCSSFSRIGKVFNLLLFKENLPLKIDFDNNENGLFHTLDSKFGNPLENQLFEIYGNSEIGYEKQLKNCINSQYNISETCQSKDEENSYIKIDFKKYSFRFKAISFNSGQYFNQNIIGSFAIEGLNSGNSWNTIQTWNNEDNCFDSLYGNMGSFSKESYRYIRIKMIGPNSSGNNRLCIQKLELFGILNESSKK